MVRMKNDPEGMVPLNEVIDYMIKDYGLRSVIAEFSEYIDMKAAQESDEIKRLRLDNAAKTLKLLCRED